MGQAVFVQGKMDATCDRRRQTSAYQSHATAEVSDVIHAQPGCSQNLVNRLPAAAPMLRTHELISGIRIIAQIRYTVRCDREGMIWATLLLAGQLWEEILILR